MSERSSTLVDTDVLLRALAITWVVANHAQSTLPLAGGMTLLLALSGYSFARFSLDGRDGRDVRRGIAGLGWRIAVPSFLVIALAQIELRDLELHELLFVGVWFDHERVARLPVWYVQVVLQLFVLLYALFLVPAVARAFRETPLRAAAVVFGVALAARALLPLVWDTSALHHHLPHLFLWNFALGWLVYFALRACDARAKLITWLGAIAASFVAWHGPDRLEFWSLVLGIGAFLAFPRVALPRLAARAVTLVSQATFAIFLLHRELMYAYTQLPWKPVYGPLARFTFAILGSVAAWIAFTAVARALRKTNTDAPRAQQPVALRRAA